MEFRNKNNLSRRNFIKTIAAAVGTVSFSAIPDIYARCSIRSSGFDLILKNALILDGTGKRSYSADIGIIADRIRKIGQIGEMNAPIILDVSGDITSPGFINIHGHTEGALLEDPEGRSSVIQGITTEISGQCGSSYGPLRGKYLDRNRQRNSEMYDFDRGWQNIGDFLDCLDKKGIGINFGTMVGHGTVRSSVIGLESRRPATSELHTIRQMIEEALRQGAFGFSTGLEYTPGSFAEIEELVELAGALKPYGLPYATHMRNEDNFLLEAVEEALLVGESADCPVQISHLKVQGEPNWNKTDRLFQMIEKAADERENVNFDRYPYIAYSTGLSNLFPAWAREGGNNRFVERLQNPAFRNRLNDYAEKKVSDLGSWNSVMISGVSSSEDKKYAGWRIGEIAEEKNIKPYECAVDMLVRNLGGVGMVGFGMTERNTERILTHPLGMLCSDGAALNRSVPGNPHPRSFGAFARFLGYYVREKGLLSLPEAVRKITSMPAEKLRLDRGVLKENAYADIVVFSPDKITDKATYENPKQYSDGVKHVFINGKAAVKDGEFTGVLAGRALRPGT